MIHGIIPDALTPSVVLDVMLRYGIDESTAYGIKRDLEKIVRIKHEQKKMLGGRS